VALIYEMCRDVCLGIICVLALLLFFVVCAPRAEPPPARRAQSTHRERPRLVSAQALPPVHTPQPVHTPSPARALLLANTPEPPANDALRRATQHAIAAYDALARVRSTTAPLLEAHAHINIATAALLAPALEPIETRRVHRAAVHARVAAARAQERRPAARTTVYVRAAARQTSDSQNVHDPGVNASLRAIMARLRAGPQRRWTADEVGAQLVTEFFGDARLPNALRTLDRISPSNTNTAIAASDAEVLSLVWERCRDPRNAQNAPALREAVLDALHESVEHDVVVCVSGRTGRLLGALAHLDFDEKTAFIQRHDALKAELFKEAAQHLDRAIAAGQKDAQWREAAAAYLAGNGATAQPFAEHLRASMRSLVRDFALRANARVPDMLTPQAVALLEDEVVAAVAD